MNLLVVLVIKLNYSLKYLGSFVGGKRKGRREEGRETHTETETEKEREIIHMQFYHILSTHHSNRKSEVQSVALEQQKLTTTCPSASNTGSQA